MESATFRSRDITINLTDDTSSETWRLVRFSDAPPIELSSSSSCCLQIKPLIRFRRTHLLLGVLKGVLPSRLSVIKKLRRDLKSERGSLGC